MCPYQYQLRKKAKTNLYMGSITTPLSTNYRAVLYIVQEECTITVHCPKPGNLHDCSHLRNAYPGIHVPTKK